MVLRTLPTQKLVICFQHISYYNPATKNVASPTLFCSRHNSSGKWRRHCIPCSRQCRAWRANMNVHGIHRPSPAAEAGKRAAARVGCVTAGSALRSCLTVWNTWALHVLDVHVQSFLEHVLCAINFAVGVDHAPVARPPLVVPAAFRPMGLVHRGHTCHQD